MHHENAASKNKAYVKSKEMNKVIYTMQQSIGCIGDSFPIQNQSRKIIGQSFEKLVTLIMQEIGLNCQPRSIKIPIPRHSPLKMSYQLDIVFSRKNKLAKKTLNVHHSEIIGSIKTTSKDRIDKIFLDKYLLTKLLGRKIPVVAIFLHDVQRAKKGKSIFGIASTFKTDHFLSYTIVLNKLDGVYYVDPRPDMLSDKLLKAQIFDFQQFLVEDLWRLSK